MKASILAIAALLVLAGCASKTHDTDMKAGTVGSIAFTEARHYFFKGNIDALPADNKITDEETFNSLFGMATVMGTDGKPTAIDFGKQMVVPFVLPATDRDTEIVPVAAELAEGRLTCSFRVTQGEQQSFKTQPLSLIIVSRDYAGCDVTLKTIE